MFQRLRQLVVIKQLVSCLGMCRLMLGYEPESFPKNSAIFKTWLVQIDIFFN